MAWYSSHLHTAEGANDPYAYCYLFAYAVEMPGQRENANAAERSEHPHPGGDGGEGKRPGAAARRVSDTLKNLDGEGGSAG